MESKTDLDQTTTTSYKSFFYFLGILLVAGGLTWWLAEPGFTTSQVYVLFLFFFAVGLWLTELIPPFAVGILVMAYLVFAMGNPLLNPDPQPIDQYVNTFSSSVIWLLLGGFLLSVAMTRTGLNKVILKFALRISGNQPKYILLCLMVISLLISTIMSNAATTTMIMASAMPLLTSLGKTKFTRALLLGIAMASVTGGMMTIIGTPPNVLAVEQALSLGHVISFPEWIIVGGPVGLILISIIYWFLVKVYLKDSNPIELGVLGNEKEFLSGRQNFERTIVIFVILITVFLWLGGSWFDIRVASVSAVPMVFLTITGIIGVKEIKSLPWDAFFLVAGGLSLGTALEHTGLLAHYADQLRLLQVSPFLLLLILAYGMMLLTGFMSDTAASAVILPLGLALMPGMEKEAAFILGLAASTAVFLPVSAIPNSIITSTGYMEQKDFSMVGLVVGVLGPLASVLWVLLIL